MLTFLIEFDHDSLYSYFLRLDFNPEEMVVQRKMRREMVSFQLLKHSIIWSSWFLAFATSAHSERRSVRRRDSLLIWKHWRCEMKFFFFVLKKRLFFPLHSGTKFSLPAHSHRWSNRDASSSNSKRFNGLTELFSSGKTNRHHWISSDLNLLFSRQI